MPLVPLLPLFHRLNREHFAGALAPGGNSLVSVRWSDGRMRRSAGLYRFGRRADGSRLSEIVLSRPLLEPLPPEATTSTLCHEMIHAWIHRVLQLQEAHGPHFRARMAAINAALVQDGRSGLKPANLLNLPADGRGVRIVVDAAALVRSGSGWTIDAGEGRTVKAEIAIAIPANAKNAAIILDGSWETRDADRVFVARNARFEDADARTRYVVFLTDGYIGNDQAVVQAVYDNARASRVYSLGIGNSVNRFLLEEMARAGRGAPPGGPAPGRDRSE